MEKHKNFRKFVHEIFPKFDGMAGIEKEVKVIGFSFLGLFWLFPRNPSRHFRVQNWLVSYFLLPWFFS